MCVVQCLVSNKVKMMLLKSQRKSVGIRMSNKMNQSLALILTVLVSSVVIVVTARRMLIRWFFDNEGECITEFACGEVRALKVSYHQGLF